MKYLTLTIACFAVLALIEEMAAATLVWNYDASADPDGGADTTWEDAAASGHDFVLGSGVSYNSSTGLSGASASYVFDGSINATANWGSGNNAENTTVGNRTGQSASFEMVFKADAITNQDILWEMGGSSKGISMTINNDTLQFADSNGGAVTTATINAGEYYHVVGVVDFAGDLMSLYLNGAAPVTAAFTGNDWAGTDGGTDGAIGSKNGSTVGGQNTIDIGGYTPFEGEVALFRYYNSNNNDVLTQSDVTSLYSATGIPEPSTLILFGLGCLLVTRRQRG